MKIRLLTLFMVVVLLILLGLTGSQSTALAQVNPLNTPTSSPSPTPASSTCQPGRSIKVRGEASVVIPPDKARLLVEINAQGINPSTLTKDISAQAIFLQTNLNKLNTSLESLPLPLSKSLPLNKGEYHQETTYNDAQTPRVYRAGKKFIVEMNASAMPNFPEVLDFIFQVKDIRILQIEFSSSQLETQMNKAREIAMDNAKANAEALTTQVDTDCILSIVEEESQATYANDFTQLKPGETHFVVQEELFPFGEIWVKIVVSVSYALK